MAYGIDFGSAFDVGISRATRFIRLLADQNFKKSTEPVYGLVAGGTQPRTIACQFWYKCFYKIDSDSL